VRAVGDHKTCTTCECVLLTSEFHGSRNRPDGLHPQCKTCGNRARRQYRRAHPQPPRVWSADSRRWHLQADYGLSPEQYDAMLSAQGGVCAICAGPETRTNREGAPRYLSVDHDHSTGRIRGLLCSTCNRGLGQFNDDVEYLRSAIAYLADPQTHSGPTGP